MAFTDGQNVQAADLNTFSVTTVTTSGAITAGGTITGNHVTAVGTVTGAALTVSAAGLSTLGGLVDISGASAGQIKFPASQNASSNANTLDDYEEFSWTPAIGFATAGDQNIAYTTQTGWGIKIGSLVMLTGTILTSTFTHTTAAGALQITGNAITAASNSVTNVGAVMWQGITKAGYTDVTVQLAAGSTVGSLVISGSGQVPTFVETGDMPTGGTVALRFNLSFRV